ncbi:MAG: hypothetical protein WDA09_10815, partial [Bacteriovoracaceae bacterium]
HLMSLGSKVNLFITEKAPWTQFKTDQDAAKETIAISAVYVLVLGAFFAPYLPKLSGNILSYFGLDANSEVVKKIYQGDMSALKDYFAKDFKLAVEPAGLVAKIDPKLIDELNEKLQAKKS